MTNWKNFRGLLLFSALFAGCAPMTPAPDVSEASVRPANPFEEAFSREPGVVPVTWGGWMKTLVAGTGASPTADSVVTVNYRGTLTDGAEFDSSYKRSRPATFSLRSVVPCWTNGVPLMKVGGKSRFVCPASSAYGAAGSPPLIPGGATLVFEIELLAIVR